MEQHNELRESLDKDNKAARSQTAPSSAESSNLDDSISQFVYQLLQDKGIDQMLNLGEFGEIAFDALAADLKQRLEFQITRAIIAQLPDRDLETLDFMMDSGTASIDVYNAMIKRAGINTDETIDRTLKIFRDAYLGDPEDN